MMPTLIVSKPIPAPLPPGEGPKLWLPSWLTDRLGLPPSAGVGEGSGKTAGGKSGEGAAGGEAGGGAAGGGFQSHGSIPIAGWCVMENPSINGWVALL